MTTTQQKTALITGITGQVGSYLGEFLLTKGYIVHGIKRRASLLNHESPHRGETFVTRKITCGLANISQGLEDCLFMGNIDALRAWGHAKGNVRMQWLVLQQDQAKDFVIATGVQYSVRKFIEWTATALGMQIRWEGKGVNEVGYWNSTPNVKIDPRYFRPTEVETLLGDPTKAKQKLGWCLRYPHRKCAPRWSPMIWRKPENMPCSNSMATQLR